MEPPSSTELVILGLLKRQPAHGYELLRFVRLRRMSEYIRLTPSGMYKALARLEEQGCITAQAEREGHRPERQTYAVTPRGEARLQELLLDHLHATPDSVDPLNAALAFGELASRRALVQELRRRREIVAGEQEEADHLLEKTPVPLEQTLFLRLVVDRWAEHLGAELRWLGKAIAHLEESREHQASDSKDKVRKDEHPVTSG